jgi:photosystem II stability/assembly factor-like uncharacterized protein
MKKLLLFSALLMLNHTFAQKRNRTAQPTVLPNQAVITENLSATAAAERLQNLAQRNALEASSLVKNIPFRSVGPTVMSGRVIDLEVNPANSAEFYVAYASGGLWKTSNNGNSFTPLFDKEAVMTIGDIAIDWKTKTIWLGTGENNSSRSSYAGIGMYKSTDDGKTWQYVGLEDSHHIGRIALHPSNPAIAWVAVLGHLYTTNENRGIYKTTDGGKTWKKTLYINDKTGGIDLRIDPSNPNQLYAAMWHRERSAHNFVGNGSESGIYKSVDGGENWTLATNATSGFPQGEGNGRIGLAIYPQNPNIIYAIMDNQANRPKEDKKVEVDANKITKKIMKSITKEAFLALSDEQINDYLDEVGFPAKFSAKNLKASLQADKIKVNDIFDYTHNGNDDLFDIQIVGAEIYRSEDAGKSWKKANKDYIDGLYYTYGYYFGQIWVADNNPNKIIVAGVPILRSEDAGQSFISMDGESIQGNVHGDHHALWIDPQDANHFILGNDGGINITYDNGKTWFKANTPAVGQFYAIQVDMEKPYNVYGGLQDNGVWVGSSAYKLGYDWYGSGQYPYKMLLGGDGMQVAVDTRDNNILYTGFQFGNYFRINKKTNERKYLQVTRELGEAPFRFNWQAPILLSKHNQDVVYYASNRFHRSMDKGDSWKTISADLTQGDKKGNVPFGTIATIDESALKFGLIYTGSDDGLVHITKDGGFSWQNITGNLPKNLWVSRVVASSFDEGTVYVALNGYRNDLLKPYVYQSTDYGQNWKQIGLNLPLSEPVNVIKEDPKNANVLYVGTDHGVYVSINKGTSFMKMDGGLPSTPVHDLLVHPRENELVVGTHGRSIWIADVSKIQALNSDILDKPIHLFEINSISESRRWGSVERYVQNEAEQFPINFYSKSAGFALITIQTEKGFAFKAITAKISVGLNTANYDLTIDDEAKDGLIKALSDDKKTIKIEAKEDKKFYIPAGKYKAVININGGKSEQNFEVKAIEKRQRRSMIPASTNSPSEFEEWYEEMGFEEKK